MSVAYADYTYRSPNPLKRFVHANRFAKLFRVVPLDETSRVLDYGCGDGYFLRTIAAQKNVRTAVGYEPDPFMRDQAIAGGGGAPVARPDEIVIPRDGFTHIFCQEVLEHLMPVELAALFTEIAALSSPRTDIIFTMPVEHRFSGLAKNLFRIARRPQTMSLRTLFSATLKRPVVRQPTLTPYGPYIDEHTGFDVDDMEREVGKRFRVTAKYNYPWPEGRLLTHFSNGRIVVCRTVEA